MLNRLGRALLAAALGISIVGLSGTPATASRTDVVRTDRALAAVLGSAVLRQATLQLPGVELGTKVVAAALADIDADGDLDLVATDGSLDLLVWSNDGTGHFARKYPAPAPIGSRLAPDGALQSGPGTVPASVAPDSGGSFVAPERLPRTIACSERHVASTTYAARSGARVSHGSRAPPFLPLAA
jgi:hypothetical protein